MLACNIALVFSLLVLNYLKLCSSVPFEITRNHCMPNKAVCMDSICVVRKNPRGLDLSSFHCALKSPIISLVIQIKFFRKEKNAYKKTFFDIEEDICRLLAGTSYSSVLARLIPKLKEHANFIHPCPFIGNITISDYPVDLSLLPFFIKRGEYRVNLSAYNINRTISYINVTTFFKFN